MEFLRKPATKSGTKRAFEQAGSDRLDDRADPSRRPRRATGASAVRAVALKPHGEGLDPWPESHDHAHLDDTAGWLGRYDAPHSRLNSSGEHRPELPGPPPRVYCRKPPRHARRRRAARSRGLRPAAPQRRRGAAVSSPAAGRGRVRAAAPGGARNRTPGPGIPRARPAAVVAWVLREERAPACPELYPAPVTFLSPPPHAHSAQDPPGSMECQEAPAGSPRVGRAQPAHADDRDPGAFAGARPSQR